MTKVTNTIASQITPQVKVINPCIRCGKERVILNSWKETVNNSQGHEVVSSYVQMVCPDEECQKIVEAELAQNKKRKEDMAQEKERKNLERKNAKKNVVL